MQKTRGNLTISARFVLPFCAEEEDDMQIGGFAVMRYVLVRYGEGKCAALLPVKEEEFIRLLEQRMSQ